MKKLSFYLCTVIVLCFLNLVSLKAEEPIKQTTDEQEKTTIQKKTTIIEAAAAYIHYLQLQRTTMQSQNRQLTLISNIMKVKHDDETNYIDNTR